MMFVYLSSFPRAGNTHKFLYQLLPSRGLETEKNELVLCQNRECEGCGRRLRSTQIRTHMRQYCPARAEEYEQGNFNVDESEDVMKEEEEDLDEIMGEVREALTISCPG